MDATVTIALITASAGVAGGLVTGSVGALTTARQDRRLEAREAARWRRELAEKDRERLYELARLIVAQQRRLFEETIVLFKTPTPHTREQQATAVVAANELADSCMHATVLGATDVGAEPLMAVGRQYRQKLRSGPMEEAAGEAARASFREEYNREASLLRERLSQNLIRLRSGQ